MFVLMYISFYFRANNYGGRNLKSIVEILNEKKSDLEAKGCKLNIKEDPFIVTVMTPLMLRTHKQAFAGEIVFVDSSGSCDQVI